VTARLAGHVRYALTAATCFCAHNAILIAADRAGLTMMQAASTSFCIMIVLGYLLLSSWAIPSERGWLGFLRYAFAMALNFPISTTLLWVFLRVFELPMVIAAPAATWSMVVVNYGMSHWALAGQQAAPDGRLGCLSLRTRFSGLTDRRD
jgi:putative flippase GtrA